MSKIFIDTNILIYSLDASDRKKQKKSRTALERLSQQDKGVISTQVMQEFYVVATKKLRVAPLLVKEILNSFSVFETVSVSPNIIHAAIECATLYGLSFWDSVILSAAESANCDLLWTEDLNHHQVLRGIRIVNPLI